MLATVNIEKLGRGLGKNANEWTGRLEISKEEIKSLAVSVACMALLPEQEIMHLKKKKNTQTNTPEYKCKMENNMLFSRNCKKKADLKV